MSNLHDNSREDDALDALIVGAFCTDNCENVDKEIPAKVTLDEEQIRALDALGPDLVDRIIAGTWQPRDAAPKGRQVRRPGKLAATALNRGEAEQDELSEKAREIERKVREAEALEDGEGRTNHHEG